MLTFCRNVRSPLSKNGERVKGIEPSSSVREAVAHLARSRRFSTFSRFVPVLKPFRDFGLSKRQIRAISRHKSAKVLTGYVKRTEKQIIDGTRKRRAGRPAIAVADDQLDLFGGEK